MVSLGSIVIGYQPPRSMRNVNPYAKFDSGSTQSFRTYNDVRASQTSRAMGRDGYIYGGVQVKTPNALHSYYPSNPTHTKEPTRFNYQVIRRPDKLHIMSAGSYVLSFNYNLLLYSLFANVKPMTLTLTFFSVRTPTVSDQHSRKGLFFTCKLHF